MPKAQGKLPTGPDGSILIGLGANLPSERFGPPRQTLEAAIAELAAGGIALLKRSRWYESAPIPASDQPWFVNGVAAAETELDPEALLGRLHEIEAAFGRIRREINAPRALDLDLLAFGTLVRHAPPPILPHPRLASRAFVLVPLAEIEPGWRHPESGLAVETLIARLPPGQKIRMLEERAPP